MSWNRKPGACPGPRNKEQEQNQSEKRRLETQSPKPYSRRAEDEHIDPPLMRPAWFFRRRVRHTPNASKGASAAAPHRPPGLEGVGEAAGFRVSVGGAGGAVGLLTSVTSSVGVAADWSVAAGEGGTRRVGVTG